MIRRMYMGDIPWLIEAAAVAQAEAPNYADLPASPAEQYKRLARILQVPDAIYIGVVEDGTGFVCGSIEPAIWFEATYAVQNLLWVAPANRGTWRAWRLVAAFEGWARERGACRVYNGVSSGLDEERTGRFYERLGYRPAGPTFVKELT